MTLMTKKGPKSMVSGNRYRQPFVLATVAAIFGFGFIYLYRDDLLWALVVSCVIFLVLFWVVLKGNTLRGQRKEDATSPSSKSRTPRKFALGLKLGFACLALMVVLIALVMVGELSEPATTNHLTQAIAAQDEEVTRTRIVQFNFWQELSDNLHPSFADGIDSSLNALEIAIHDMEKNWPTGPTIVTYEGTAKDAFMIHQALRSAGLPVSGYMAVE